MRGVQCRGQPEPALYNGGILKFGSSSSGGGDPDGYRTTETGVFSPAFVVYNLNKTTMYTFSCELSYPFCSHVVVHACEADYYYARRLVHVSFNNSRSLSHACRLGEAGRRVLGSDHREAGAGQHRRQVHRHGGCQERLLGLRQGRIRPGLADADLGHLLSGTRASTHRMHALNWQIEVFIIYCSCARPAEC